MRTEFDKERVIFHFEGPVTVELPDDAFQVPADQSVTEIVLNFQGVKLISSLVIANLIELLNREKNRKIKLVNMGQDMRTLFDRTGLSGFAEIE